MMQRSNGVNLIKMLIRKRNGEAFSCDKIR